jgi:4-hydroxy-3-methylbut-2-enyl diphosphate reductase
MSGNTKKEHLLFTASKLGFCNGVRRALEAVEDILCENQGKTSVYIFNEIVHNTFIVNNLKQRGVTFIHSLDEVPDSSVIIWSAHGVPPELEDRARARNLIIKDATCPLVKRLHNLASEYSQRGDAVIFIGHAGHPETIGVLGCGDIYCVSDESDCDNLPDFPEHQQISLLTQTTLCRSEIEGIQQKLQKRYPQLQTAGGICYATAERQQAVRDLIEHDNIEQLIVIGSPRSSNSNRLCDVARQYNVPAILVDDPEELANLELTNIYRLGLTAGASAPEILLDKALKILTEKHHYKIL